VGKGLRILMGPAGVEPATNQAEYIAMRYLSVSARLLLSEPCVRLSTHTALQGCGLCSTIPCTPSPCTGHYPNHLSTMGTPSPCVRRRLGDPQVLLKLWSECRFLVRCFTRFWRKSQGKRSTALITTAIDPVH
jgi:hypothetical protein